MRFRATLIAAGSLFAASILAACGGAGGSVSLPVTGSPQPSPSPQSASYSGTKTVAFTYNYAFAYPTPAPGTTAPPTTIPYTVTESVTVGTSPNPTGVTAKSVDVHVAETDATNLQTQSYASDSWVSPLSGSNVALYATTQREPSSTNVPVETTIYTTAQTLDQVPETNGASWTNSPASTVSYSYADGNSGTRTIAADGSYFDLEQMGAPSQGGAAVDLTENSDGSGTIGGPFYGGGIIDGMAFSAPTAGNVYVTIAWSQYMQQNYGYPPTSTTPDVAWYTTPLFSETDTVTTGVSLPAACANSYGTTANDVRRSVTSTDTLVGYTETTQFDAYMINGLPTCLVTNDVQSYAYDEKGTSPYLILVGPLGLETITTNQTLVLQAGAVGPLPASRVHASVASAPALNTAAVSAIEAHQLAAFTRARAQRLHALIKELHQGGRK